MKKKYHSPLEKEQQSEEIASKQPEINAFKLMMGNRKNNNKKIPNSAFDF